MPQGKEARLDRQHQTHLGMETSGHFSHKEETKVQERKGKVFHLGGKQVYSTQEEGS